MPTPQELRKIRIRNDYTQMCNIRGNIISWQPVTGVAPYIEAYRITINVRTIIGVGGAIPKYRESSVVMLTLPPEYPKSAPIIMMESSPQPYHPNWFDNKKWCYGTWNMSEALGDHVIRMIKTLQFDQLITNEDSPANSEANSWYILNKNSRWFPCDTTTLPDPSSAPPPPPSNKGTFTVKNWKK